MKNEIKIIKSDEKKWTKVPWGLTKILINQKTGSKNIELRFTKMVPGKSHALHVHDVDEIIIIISGMMTHVLDKDDSRIFGPNNVIFIPAGVMHGGDVYGEEPLRMYVIFSPPLK